MDAKDGVRERLNAARTGLIEMSHRIHGSPEIAYEEEKASAWLCEALDAAGFAVERGVAGLPTAFKATYGSGPLNIGICAEFDALPGIGHACGHNIIASAGIGAAMAAAQVADDLGITVTVMGTPAEEYIKSGGKITMLEQGAFDGLHAAIMVHPMPEDVVAVPLIAAAGFEVRYHGKSAHASSAPDQGVNAGDAMTIAQAAIGLMRPTLRPTDRVHGIVTKGGDAFNIIPELVTADFGVRATTLDDLDSVYQKVLRCFEAGAVATGARLEVDGGSKPFAHMVHDTELATLYGRNLADSGRTFISEEEAWRRPVSSDMGNVSLEVPSMHPGIAIDTKGAVNHQPEFTAACATESADRAVYDGALGLALTAVDMATVPSLRERLMVSRK
jgi:amidohydrolase